MEKPWLAHYPAGVVHTINPEQYTSVTHILLDAVNRHSDAIAVVNFGVALTYAELAELSAQLAAYLYAQGWRKGDSLAVMLPNCLQYPIVLLAAWRLGITVTNVNPLYTRHEVAKQCQDAAVKGIIVFNHYARTVEQAASQYPFSHVITTGIGDLFGMSKRVVANLIVTIKRLAPRCRLHNTVTLRTALTQGKSLPLPEITVTGDDIALLQYTGGTTGDSRGVILTHRNLVANMLQVQAWLSPILRRKQVTAIVALPLYHIFSLTANLLLLLNIGGKLVLITDPRKLTSFIITLKNTSFNILLGVNTLFNAMLHHPRFNEIDFSSLDVTLAGGMALQKAVADKWQQRTGHALLQGYGLTEASPVVAITPLTSKMFTGTIGLPVPSTDVSVRDEHGQDVAQGEVGELWVRGPQVMQGYWQHPTETANVLQQGWLRTGDMVTCDQDGYLYLVDRKGDVIIVSGFNVYPNEIEDVIAKHPGVNEVAVVGVNAHDGNEQIKAVIVKNDPALTKEQLQTHCRDWLTAYKIPKIIEFRDALPKSAVGKILRHRLRDNIGE